MLAARAADYAQAGADDVSKAVGLVARRMAWVFTAALLLVIGLTTASVSVLMLAATETRHPALWIWPATLLVAAGLCAWRGTTRPPTGLFQGVRALASTDLESLQQVQKDGAPGARAVARRGAKAVLARWWRRHPLNTLVSWASEVYGPPMAGVATQHPWALLLLAASAGAAVVALLPSKVRAVLVLAGTAQGSRLGRSLIDALH